MKMYGKDGGMDHKPKAANERYMPKGMKGKMMGHANAPQSIKILFGEGYKGQKMREGNKGYPNQAFDYKY